MHEGDVEQGAAAAHQALDDAARADSALVTSRLKTCWTRPRRTTPQPPAMVRARTRELTARRSTAVAASTAATASREPSADRAGNSGRIAAVRRRVGACP
ncbi:hypothetical protein ACU686_09830 [Yinghuangia aomiensis]